MARLHHLHLAAQPFPEFFQLLDGAGIRAGRRRDDAPAIIEQAGKAASGPEYSVPAMGWAGMKCTPCGAEGRDVAHDRALDRTDIGQDRARLQMRRDVRRDLL